MKEKLEEIMRTHGQELTLVRRNKIAHAKISIAIASNTKTISRTKISGK